MTPLASGFRFQSELVDRSHLQSRKHHMVILLTWILIIVQAVAIFAIAKRLLEVQRLVTVKSGVEASTLPIGTPAPNFSAKNIHTGEPIRSSDLIQSGISMMIFLSPHCGNCRGVARELSDLTIEELKQIVVYCDGTTTGCRNHYGSLGERVQVLVKDDLDVAIEFQLSGLPAAVFLDSSGKIQGAKHIFEVRGALMFKESTSGNHTRPISHTVRLAESDSDLLI